MRHARPCSCRSTKPAWTCFPCRAAAVNWGIRPRPDSDGNYGRLQAIDLATRETLWTARQRAPLTSGVLSTAGGLVFAASLDRFLRAHDARSGEVLWEARLNDVS